MPRARKLPINCAARNAVWVFPRVAPPRFPGAPEVMETARSHQMPDFSALPEGSDVTVELYGGACSLWLDGENHRVYVRRFHYAGFTSQDEAWRAFLELWREVERLGSAKEVEGAAGRWVERRARPIGASWLVDETYIRVRGRRAHLRRAVDKHGLTVDFLLSENRDISAAKQLFTRAVERHGAPERITLDGYPATHAAAAELKKDDVLRPEMKVWTSKYFNNLVEQDHRRVKPRICPMPGFKSFINAAATISGMELPQKIVKGQFEMTRMRGGAEAGVVQVWEAILAA